MHQHKELLMAPYCNKSLHDKVVSLDDAQAVFGLEVLAEQGHHQTFHDTLGLLRVLTQASVVKH